MSKWDTNEIIRTPRVTDIVIDENGAQGIITKVDGNLSDRLYQIQDINGTIVYENYELKNIHLVDLETSLNFHYNRYINKGYVPGGLCIFKGNSNFPLRIIKMYWATGRNAMSIVLKSTREFQPELMYYEDYDNGNLVPLYNDIKRETIFCDYDSGTKWRLNVSLIETNKSGWTNTGSPWEFNNKESALLEVEAWKARLKIRRVASFLALDWKIKFPCWSIEAIKIQNNIFARVVEIKSFNGAPGYFKSAESAAIALSIITPQEWYDTYNMLYDNMTI